MKVLQFLFVFLLFSSCSKEKRFEGDLDGSWELSRMMVTDGQLQEHIINNPKGDVDFNFQDLNVSGSCLFNIPIDTILYEFFIDFSGPDLISNIESRTLTFGLGTFQNNYQIILLTKRDLVLEYYDDLNFQLRKFIFIKQD